MTAARAALLLGAGLAAGVVGSAGGTASLISYPALLAVGLPPLSANITNSLAVVAAWPGSALGSRPELRGQAERLLRWAPVSVAGSIAGALLLLLTPAAVFDMIVPFLLAFAALALLLQPWISAWLARRAGGGGRLLMPGGLLATSCYNGYWGAGSGIMTLALLLIGTDLGPARSNAAKNMLLGISDVTCCIIFILRWSIDWAVVLPLAAGFLAGAALGPGVARRLPGSVLRVVAALAGLALAIDLGIASR